MIAETKLRVLVTTVPASAGGGILEVHRILFLSSSLRSFHITLWPCMSPLPYTEPFAARITRVAIGSLRMLFFLARNRDVRVVHINSTPDIKAVLRDALLLLVTRFFRRHAVVQLHSEIKEEFPYVLRPVWRYLIRNSRYVLVLSRADVKRLESQHPSTRFQYVPNAVRTRDFAGKPKRSDFPGIPATHRVILCASRCIREKGLFELLEAVPHVLTEHPLVSFLLAGDGPELPGLKAAVKESRLSDHVHLLGHLGYQELVGVFISSDIFILPSYSEGLPNVILQALAAGLPIVATHVGGIPDVLMDGKNGLLIAPRNVKQIAEAVSVLLADRDLCEQMSARNLRLAREKYDVDVVADLLGRVYRKAAGPVVGDRGRQASSD